LRRGNIHEDPPSSLFQLKGFGVAVQFDLAELIASRGIDNPEPAAP